MIKRRKLRSQKRFSSHHSAHLSPLTAEGTENREADLGDWTMCSENSCGFVPGCTANKIWLGPKSPGRFTALCLSMALQVYPQARHLGPTLGSWAGFQIGVSMCSVAWQSRAGCSQGLPGSQPLLLCEESLSNVVVITQSHAFHLSQVTLGITSDIIKHRNH